mmetsp:Transcript_6729/g.27381  ORF Transcript_6729/g.27381 Transcript_6729/m.27381 type:complete len:147 (+) Transcript_6729:2601-3041(+)
MEVPVAIAAGRRNDAASTEPFGASRETRANGVEAATKKQKRNFFDFLQMRSSRRFCRRETKEFRRRSVSESLLPTREGSSDGYSRRREGRSVLDPTTSRAARMMIIILARQGVSVARSATLVARASRVIGVCSGYPASVFVGDCRA